MACTNLFCKYFATRSQCFSVIVQCWNIQLFPFYKNKERLKKKYERESVTWVLKKEMNSWGDYSSKAREGYYIRPIFVISIVFLYLGLTFRQFKSLAQTLLCFQKPSCTKRKMSWLTCQGHTRQMNPTEVETLEKNGKHKSLIKKKLQIYRFLKTDTWIQHMCLKLVRKIMRYILPWIKIINFVIRTFTPIIYQNS